MHLFDQSNKTYFAVFKTRHGPHPAKGLQAPETILFQHVSVMIGEIITATS